MSAVAKVATAESNAQNKMWTLDKEMVLEYLYKAGSELDLNSWSDSSVG